MLRIGIIGKNYSESYISIINASNSYDLVGIFDPGFQFEYPKNINKDLIYLSFETLTKKCDVIAFASPEKIYLPLIELALKYSKPVFLHSVHNLSHKEQVELLKLNDEAGEILQIQQPIIFHETFKAYHDICKNPLLLQYFYSDNSESKLLVKTRMVVGATLSLFNSTVRKITANTISACREVPDIIKIRIDFDNGSLADIMVNCIEEKKIHQIKTFEYNGFFDLKLNETEIKGVKNNKNIYIKSLPENNIPQKLLEKQLSDFFHNVTFHKTPINTIENEILTQLIIDKVKEKLRVNINIF